MLTLYLPRLPMGGIERASVTLLNQWAAEGYPAALLLDRAEGDLMQAVAGAVPVHSLGVRRTARALPALVCWLRRNRPRALHSALPHNSIVALVAGRLTGTRVTVAEHSLLCDKLRIDRGIRRIAPLMRRLYPLAATLLAPSAAIAGDLATTLGLQTPISVIGNPVVPSGFDPTVLARPAALPFDRPTFLAIGRLSPIKDYATLLRAFQRVRQHRPARLLILGEGPDRPRLHALAEELGIGADCAMPGLVADPWPYLAHASALVVSSISEGFGNTLVEAMACGTQVVATRCGGPTELLRDGALGRLAAVGDPASLGEAMLGSIDRPVDRDTLRQAAAQFAVPLIAECYRRAILPGGYP